MIFWLAHASLPILIIAIFLSMYVAAAVVLLVLYLVRRWGHLAHLGPLSPGLLSPMGLIFGLLVADVWADRAQAAGAVSEEASALRDIDLLMRAFPTQHPQMQQLLRDQIDAYVTIEWPEMSAGQATLSVAPAQLVQAQGLAL